MAGFSDGRFVNSLMMNDGLCSRYAKVGLQLDASILGIARHGLTDVSS